MTSADIEKYGLYWLSEEDARNAVAMAEMPCGDHFDWAGVAVDDDQR